MDKNYNIVTNGESVHSFQLSVESAQPLERSQISSLVALALDQGRPKEARSLKIVEDGQAVHYQWDVGESKALDLQKIPPKVDLKIIELADRALPQRKLSIKAIYNRLVSMRAGRVPVVNALWHLVAAPVSLFIKMFRIKVSDISELKAFADSSKNLLPTALRWAQEIFPGDLKEDALAARGEAFTLKAQLKEAASIAERQEKEDLKTLAEELTTTLLERVKPENASLTAMLIPTGYWDKGEFQPLMLAFSISEEGRLKLSLYRYGEQKENALSEFEWEGEPSEESIAEVLKTLFELQFIEEREPSKKSKMDWMRLGIVSMALMKNADNFLGDMPKPSRYDVENFDKYIPKLLASAGCKPVPMAIERRQRIGNDPWKLLHETLRFQFPDQPLGDKFYFAYALFTDRLKLVLKNYERLSKEEKKSWVLRLDKELTSLKREYLKSGAVEFDELLKPLEKEIQALSIRLEAVTRITKKEQKRKLEPLQGVKKAYSDAVVITPKDKEAGLTGAVIKPFIMTRADWALASEVGKALEASDFEKTVQSMAQVVSRMDALNDAKAYEECSLLFKMAMGEFLKLDRADQFDIFWKNLEERCLEKQDFTLMRSMSATLQEAMHQFTEAKLKLWQTPLIPEEFAYVALVLESGRKAEEFERSWLIARLGLERVEDKNRSSFISDLQKLKEMGVSYEEVARLFSDEAIDPFNTQDISLRYNTKGAIPLARNLPELAYNNVAHDVKAVSSGAGFTSTALSEGNARYLQLFHEQKTIGAGSLGAVDLYKILKNGEKERIYSFHDLWREFHGEKCRRDNDNALLPAPISSQHPVPPERILRLQTKICLSALLRPASLSKDPSKVEDLRVRIQGEGRLKWEAESILGLPHHVKIKLTVGGNKVTNFYPLDSHAGEYPKREAGGLDTCFWNYGGSLLGRPELRDKQRVGEMHYRKVRLFTSQPIYPPKGSPLKKYGVQEAELLVECLSDESNSAPLESWRRDCLDVTGPDYDSELLGPVKVLEWILQTPQKLNDQEVRRLLFSRAFHAASRMINVKEEFQADSNLSEVIQEAIQSAIDRKDFRAALFTLNLCERMQVYPGLKLPNFETKYELNGEKIDGLELIKRIAMEKALPIDLQADALSAYLMAAVHGKVAPDELNAVELMAFKVRLDSVHGALTLPFTYQTVDDWIKCTLMPAFLKEDREEKPTGLLNRLLKERYPEAIVGNWKKNEELGLEVWENAHYTINLQTLQIIDRGNPTYTSKKPIPEEILQSEQFRKAFGSYSGIAEEVVDCNTGMISYRFKNSVGDECEVLTGSGSLIMKKKFQGSWHLFTIPGNYEIQGALNQLKRTIQALKTASKGGLKGADLILNQKGIWIDPHSPRQAILNGSEEDPIRVIFNKRGLVRKIINKKGQRAIFGEQTTLQKLICPTNKNDILYFNQGGESPVTCVRILSSNLEIRKGKKERWIISSDGPYKGMEWKIAGIGTPFASLLKEIDPPLEQQAIVVRNAEKGESHLLIWTKPVDPKQTEPLKVTISDRGEITGTAAGLLLMSALLSSRGRYQHAKHFLEKAAHVRVSSVKEFALLDRARQQIEKWPEQTGREIAFKIKALLLIASIQRMQGNNPALLPGREEEFIKKTEAIGKLYDVYQKRVTHAFHGRGKIADRALEEDLILNAAELREIEMLHKESLALFKKNPEAFKTAPEDVLPLREGVKGLLIPVMADLFNQMEKPDNKNISSDLLSKLSDSTFLKKHFFEIWNAIIDQKMKPEQMRLLFAPSDMEGIPEEAIALLSGDMSGIADLELQEEDVGFALENAQNAIHGDFLIVATIKRALLSLASLSAEEKEKARIDLPQLYAARKKQPSTIFGAINAGVKLFKNKPLAGIEVVGDILKKMSLALQSSEPVIAADGSAHKEPAFDLQFPVRFVQQEQFGQEEPLFGERQEQFKGLLQGRERMPLQEFVQRSESDLGIHAAEAIREVEMSKRCAALEQRLKNVQNRIALPTEVTVAVSREAPDLLKFWEEASLHADRPQERVAGLKGALCNDDPLLAAGLDEAAGILEESQKFRAIPIKQFKKFKAAYRAEHMAAELEANRYKKEIFALLQTEEVQEALPLKLRALVKDPALAIEGELFEQLLNNYQRMNFNHPALEEKITNYLLAKTEAQQLSARSNELLDQLQLLLKMKPKQKSAEYDEWMLEWTLYSSELRKVYVAGKERTRYLDESGKLLNPRFTRKYLIAEYRSERILRKDQRDLIEKMERNPAEFYELKMGAGKTSMILPVVMNLLAENGEYPVLLIKEELLNQNMEDLDLFTRLLFEQAATVFRFEVNQPINAAILQEQYLRLLEVKQDKGYIVSSVHAKAALEQTLGLLTAQFADEPSIEVRKQIQELIKIRTLLNGDEERYGFKTITLGDEIDDIFDVRKEDNLSQGSPEALNASICEALERILTAIHTSQDPSVVKLKNALAKGTQAALLPSTLKAEILPALAREVSLQHALYLTTPGEEPPAVHSEEEKKVLGALKHLFQITLASCFRQDPGIDVGIKESNGYTVGPQQKGLEKSGYIFGDEFDVITNHYFQYAVRLPDNEFTKKALQELSESHEREYEELCIKAEERELSLLDYLNLPENYALRINHFHRAIREKNLIRRFPKQFNVKNQEVVFGTRLGGVTGTLNRYVMPLGEKANSDALLTPQNCAVEAEVLLRIAAGAPPPVESASEEALLDKMADRLSDTNCKAIINEGASLKGMDALAVANYFASKKQKRTIVFIHPECNDPRLSRKICLMDKEGEASPVTKEELNRHLRDPKFKKRVLFYFGPPDTRGTDFVIPPGYGLVLTGPTSSRESFQQAVARLRGLGEKHSVQFLVPQAVRERISTDNRAIDWTELYGDIKSRSNEEEKALHHQAFIQSLSLHLTRGIKNSLYSLNEAFDSKEEMRIFTDFYRTVEREILPSKSTDLLKEFAKSREITLQEKVTDLFEGFEKRLTAIADSLPKDHLYRQKILEIQKILQEERERVLESLPYHQEHQPKTFSTAASGMENTVAVVQEQVQVQQQVQQQSLVQQQQQQLQVGRVKARISGEKFKYDRNIMEMAFSIPTYDAHPSVTWLNQGANDDLQFELYECGFDEDLYVSKHMAFMLNQMGQRNGTPLGTIIYQSGRVMLISQRDLAIAFAHARHVTFLALVPGDKHPKGYVELGKRRGQLLKNELETEPKALVLGEKIVQMKWLLGYSAFSEEELVQLKQWIGSLSDELYRNLVQYTRNNGTRDQLRLLDNLHK